MFKGAYLEVQAAIESPDCAADSAEAMSSTLHLPVP